MYRSSFKISCSEFSSNFAREGGAMNSEAGSISVANSYILETLPMMVVQYTQKSQY